MIESSIIQPSQVKDQGNFNYITKEYPLIKLKGTVKVKKKIKYNNPDDFDKVLSLISSEHYLTLPKTQINLPYKSSKYIRFFLVMPKTLAKYRPKIYIKNLRNDEMEEVLQFNIEVIGDNEEA